jgi:hypothetical protein
LQGGLERGTEVPGVDPRVAQGLGARAQTLGLRRLASEGLDDQRAVDRLVRDGRDVRHALEPALCRSLHATGERAIQHDRRRYDHQPDRRQERIRNEERGQREDREERRPDGERDGVVHVDGGFDVGLHVREQLARRGRAVVVEGELAIAVGHPRAERGGDGGPGDAAVVAPHHDRDRA